MIIIDTHRLPQATPKTFKGVKTTLMNEVQQALRWQNELTDANGTQMGCKRDAKGTHNFDDGRKRDAKGTQKAVDTY
jgi:hypothetical protein